jgi:hypothetical protein
MEGGRERDRTAKISSRRRPRHSPAQAGGALGTEGGGGSGAQRVGDSDRGSAGAAPPASESAPAGGARALDYDFALDKDFPGADGNHPRCRRELSVL